jgi:RimJ/RimL family protein N-acetyltransferase
MEAVDRAGIEAMISRCSAETLYRRFFTPIPQPAEDETMLDRLPRVGPGDAVDVVEVAGRIVGMGSFHRQDGEDEAEVALLVEDAFQGRGLGTELVGHLAGRAVAAGVTRFVADTLVDNHGPLGAIRNAGYDPQRVASVGGVTRVIIPLIPAEQTTD